MSERECAICYPRDVPCEGECEGLAEATHDVVVGNDLVLAPTPAGMVATYPNRTKPMCHSCAVKERAEKDAGHADD